jgi:glycosyltransferase involved in cell wall biosynthesis
MKVSIVIPVLEREPRLAATVGRLAELRASLDLDILLVVDVPNASREREIRADNDAVAAASGATVLYRVGQRGFGSALRHGFSAASGDVVIPFMGDACDDSGDIPKLIATVQEGWDVVGGSRYMPGGRILGNTFKQRMSRLYGFLVRVVGGPPIRDVSNAFKAYRRSVVRSIPTVADSYDLSVELTVKAHQAGFGVTEIPTTWTNRELGASNWKVSNELRRYTRWLILAARGRKRVAQRSPGAIPSSEPRERT